MLFPLNAFLQTIFLTPFQESSQSSFSTGTATSSLKTDNHEDHNSRSNPSSVTDPMINSKIFPISLEKNFLFRIAIYGFFVMLLGLIGGFFGHFGYDFVFSRFNDAITQIFTTYLGGSSTGSTSAVGATALLSLQDSIMLGRWVTSLFSILSSLFFGIGAICLVGIILLACLGLLATSIHYLLEKIFKTVQNVSTTSLLFPSWAEGIILDLSLLIPFIVVILPFIYWGIFLLFQGEIFNRDFFSLTVFGIVLVLLAYLLALGLLTLFTRVYRRSLQKMTISTSSLNLYVSTWNQRYKKILLFTSAMLIIIILSFIPFMWWIQYLDQNLSTFGYVIRKAGELYSDPNSPIECIPNPNNPGQNCLTYTWIFFDFYTNWRYSYTNAYNVVESLGGFIGPLFISCFPFFLAGIFAFYKRKDYANLTFYLSWFLLVLFIFIPAKFQLNYYYLGAFFPYFGTVAYGIFFSSQKLRTVIHFKDRYERMIVIFPLLLLLIFTQIIPYITQINTVLSNSALCAQFLASLILIIGLFVILALFFVRSIPGMFAAMLVTFNVQRYIWSNGWGQLDAQFLVINLVLIAAPLYLLRDRIPLRSLFFIGLIIFSGTLATSWWIYWNSNEGHNNLSYNGLDNIGPFITAHGVAYNGSYWVFPEAGTRYALRYFSNGFYSVNVFSFDRNYPFSGNSNSTMQTYIQNYPDLKFFVLLGSNSPFNPSQVPPETSFPVAYSWLETQPNWVFANRLVNLPVDNNIQLYVRSTVLTPTELHQLNLSTNIGQQNDFSLHRLNSFRQRVSYQSVFTTIQSLSIVNNPWFSNLISIRKWYGIKSIFH